MLDFRPLSRPNLFSYLHFLYFDHSPLIPSPTPLRLFSLPSPPLPSPLHLLFSSLLLFPFLFSPLSLTLRISSCPPRFSFFSFPLLSSLTLILFLSSCPLLLSPLLLSPLLFPLSSPLLSSFCSPLSSPLLSSLLFSYPLFPLLSSSPLFPLLSSHLRNILPL